MSTKSKDQHARVSYLYQASQLLFRNVQEPTLSRHYISTAKDVSQKSVMRIHPDIKRTICKGCNSLLVPGKSCSIRFEEPSRKNPSIDRVLWICKKCAFKKRFSDKSC
ncbi:RNase P subunit Rpr2 [Schizosaccharomyces pombe]|uniref:Ribonuclease P protein subunit rpr2 n=1 Tax=Schizosaccharomyces pombe (strain 972 / ATCC 24843) TaxID=284812 RepID=RPR2_SCHPO|nr:putative RNase P subunit Rpr2 [Schizosaccharomyces pombe]Q9Y813.1 RecName: Full=Ribonuclease P protein subunit rpr2; AltName: Full=RNA-processing protein rpr2 [Schizosaccharomyces pombe 972h-]CAB50979.1 RNase P subunit Rpr2 (predicted) [Schizosaccharomyces pombe]|eukprot:NP_596472.1 putative RNase P subunit Rpr2 [Schizosaccharomyces pombe]